MTRYPSRDRAVRQLERHSSGTPNDVPPTPPTLEQSMAALAAAAAAVSAKILAGLDAWAKSRRSTPTAPAPAEFTSYYGPTAWDNDAGHLWHRDCPDTRGVGHDGEVLYWKDSSASCTGCDQGLDPEGVEATS